jgi:putative transposase
VYLYHRFALSLRDVEDLIAERGVTVSYETIRVWCAHFGPAFARRLRKRQAGGGDHWYLDEMHFVTVRGERRLLWRAVDQDGDTLDILVQKRNDKQAALRFFKKPLKTQGRSPNRLTTDKLPSYGAAKRELMPDVSHVTDRYKNNRAEVSHEKTRVRERQMRKFKSPGQAQRFLVVHDRVQNLFRLGRHLTSAGNFRTLRARSFAEWQQVTCA